VVVDAPVRPFDRGQIKWILLAIRTASVSGSPEGPSSSAVEANDDVRRSNPSEIELRCVDGHTLPTRPRARA
jgi:hypothetical protein